MEQVTHRIKVEMALWGLDARQLARRARINEGQLSHILNNKHRPQPQTLRRIVEAIHADILSDPPKAGAKKAGAAKAGK